MFRSGSRAQSLPEAVWRGLSPRSAAIDQPAQHPQDRPQDWHQAEQVLSTVQQDSAPDFVSVGGTAESRQIHQVWLHHHQQNRRLLYHHLRFAARSPALQKTHHRYFQNHQLLFLKTLQNLYRQRNHHVAEAAVAGSHQKPPEDKIPVDRTATVSDWPAVSFQQL